MTEAEAEETGRNSAGDRAGLCNEVKPLMFNGDEFFPSIKGARQLPCPSEVTKAIEQEFGLLANRQAVSHARHLRISTRERARLPFQRT